jgi:16S rRNA (cytosine967-C5)-methyltransferase
VSDLDTIGLPAREAAAQFLEAALAKRTGLDDAFAGPAARGLEPRDRAFARALTMAALRHLGTIDRVLEPKLQRAPPERVMSLLRLGATQLFWMDVPDHAAVSTMVALADRVAPTRKFKGLINAVLRGLQRDGKPADDHETLAPAWLMARWQAAYGPVEARALAAAIAEEPATDLSVKDPADAAALADLLEGAVLPGGSIRTRKRGDLAEWPAFVEGRWWVQDAGAAIPTRLLDVKPGETALDLCAAPGGKTLQLAAAGATVVAVDRNRRPAEAGHREPRPDAPDRRGGHRRRPHLERQADLRRGPAGRPLLRHRHVPPPSGRAVGRRAGRHRQPGRAFRPACSTPPPPG